MIRKSMIILSSAAFLLILALWPASILRPMRWELLETDRMFLTATIEEGRISAHLQRAPTTDDGPQTLNKWKKTDRSAWTNRSLPRKSPAIQQLPWPFAYQPVFRPPPPPPSLAWSFQRDDTSASLTFPLWLPLAVLSPGPLLAALGLVRRRHRRNKGLCLKCGYDLTGLPQPRCPECGAGFSPEEAPAASRARRPRLLKRIALTACLFLLLMWGASTYWQLSVSRWQRVSLGRTRVLGLGLRRGCLICERYPPDTDYPVIRNEWSWGFGRYGLSATWTPSATIGPYSRSLELPLWLFVAVAAAPTALLWWCDRRRPAAATVPFAK